MVSGAGRTSLRDRLTIPAHPSLAAAFFVLFLFAENAIQMVNTDSLWLPLLAVIAGSIGVLLLTTLAYRDWLRGGLLATWLIVLFFSFGHAWVVVEPYDVPREWLLATWLVLMLAGPPLIRATRRWIRPATRFLNAVAALLVVFNAGAIVGYAINAPAIALGSSKVVPLADTSVKPDIYYIVLDRYGNSTTLREVYDFDNTPFLDELRARGFAVADDAWANHFKTALSLSSAMNMDYLQADNLPAGPTDFGPVYHLLAGHRAVPDTLTANGYEYIHLGNYWEPTATNVDADRALRFSEQSAFAAALSQTSALSLLSPPVTGDADPETLDFPTLARDHTLFTFNELEASRDLSGPTYVFAHILVPHPPYVFNADGSYPSRRDVQQRGGKESYRQQVEYANARVLQAIDHLLDVPADQQPVIVLMADEGPFPDRYAVDEAGFNWISQATDLEIQQKFGILNALYLPGGRNPADYGFTNRTSPVNEFRIVFNALFDTNLPLLPNLTYLSPDYAHIYDFVLYPR